MSKSEFKMLFISCIIFPAIFVLAQEDLREKAYYGIFGLDGDNTVADYKNSSIDLKVQWQLNACKYGKCLLRVDWQCGFENGNEIAVKSCFESEMMTGNLGTLLDTIRKECGRRHMVFVGELYAKKSHCNGVWGRRN